MRGVVLAELTEGVPRMLDMSAVQYGFARHRKEDLFHFALKCALDARSRAGPRRLYLGTPLEPENAQHIAALSAVRRVRQYAGHLLAPSRS